MQIRFIKRRRNIKNQYFGFLVRRMFLYIWCIEWKWSPRAHIKKVKTCIYQNWQSAMLLEMMVIVIWWCCNHGYTVLKHKKINSLRAILNYKKKKRLLLGLDKWRNFHEANNWATLTIPYTPILVREKYNCTFSQCSDLIHNVIPNPYNAIPFPLF